MTEWHTGIPPVVDIDEDNEYCYAICIWYDGWWLSDYLFKANYEEVVLNQHRKEMKSH